MRISLIAAVAENGAIGKGNKLPWHLPGDLRFFKKTTLGHPVIMGRKNFESIGKALPGRLNIVLTRRAGFASIVSMFSVLAVHSLEEALEEARKSGADECFVIGGADVYRQALPFCQKLYITRVHGAFEGDAFMPEFEKGFRRVCAEKNFKDEFNECDYDFEIWERN